MSKVTEAEKWFGKKKKDLTQEEQKVFYKLKSKTLQHQLNQQKAMWNKLKEWVSFTQPKNINDEFISGVCSAYSNVIDKMQELEKGEKDVED